MLAPLGSLSAEPNPIPSPSPQLKPEPSRAERRESSVLYKSLSWPGLNRAGLGGLRGAQSNVGPAAGMVMVGYGCIQSIK